MLILKYDGLDAERHRLDALTGGESLAGFGHALTLISHYAATGQVRFRAPYSRDVRFYFTGSRDGSLEWVIQTVANHPEAIALGLGANGLSALVAYVFNRAIGREPDTDLREIEKLDGARSGDLEALIEAVEPSVRRAHRVIGSSAAEITLFDPERPAARAYFDRTSKDYLENDLNGGISTQDVSVGALNVNSRYGRAFFADLGRTVPFKVAREAHPRTMTELSRGINNYAKKNGLTVSIRFMKILAVDDRLKRVIIYDAYHLESDDR